MFPDLPIFNFRDLVNYQRRNFQLLYDELQGDPESVCQKLWGSYLSCDNHCIVRAGYGREYQQGGCWMCQSLYHTFDFCDPRESQPLSVHGEVNDFILQRRTRGNNPTLSRNVTPVTEDIYSRSQDLSSCGLDSKSLAVDYYVSDGTTNSIIVAIIVDQILRNHDLSSHVPVLAWNCDSHCYELRTRYNNATLAEILDHGLPEFLDQASVLLHNLASHQFTHEFLTYDSFFCHYHDNKVSYICDTKEKSAITINGKRWCRERILSPSKSVIRTKVVFVSQRRITFYRLTVEQWDYFLTCRQHGVPLYPGSFDLYVLIFSLLRGDRSGRVILALTNVLNLLFPYPEDLNRVISANYQNDTIRVLMSDLWLRCDAHQIFWASRKSHSPL